jgi:signal transduction histidine kinase
MFDRVMVEVADNGETITVRSKLGVGTTFSFNLSKI